MQKNTHDVRIDGDTPDRRENTPRRRCKLDHTTCVATYKENSGHIDSNWWRFHRRRVQGKPSISIVFCKVLLQCITKTFQCIGSVMKKSMFQKLSCCIKAIVRVPCLWQNLGNGPMCRRNTPWSSSLGPYAESTRLGKSIFRSMRSATSMIWTLCFAAQIHELWRAYTHFNGLVRLRCLRLRQPNQVFIGINSDDFLLLVLFNQVIDSHRQKRGDLSCYLSVGLHKRLLYFIFTVKGSYATNANRKE